MKFRALYVKIQFFLSTLSRYRGGVYIQLHSLASALDGGEWLASRHGRFTHRNNPPYRLNRRVGGLHSRSGRFWGRGKPLAPKAIRTPDCPSHSLAAIPTTADLQSPISFVALT